MESDTREKIKSPPPGLLVATQLNVVTLVDVAGALAADGLNDHAWMMDNGPLSTGKGTNALETVCRVGQVLNWLIYCTDMAKRIDGTWPPFARIINIVFLNEDRTTVSSTKICTDLKVFGAPAAILNRATPCYYYWAGAVMPNLKPGLYPYRLILELETGCAGGTRHYNMEGPALRVLPATYGL